MQLWSRTAAQEIRAYLGDRLVPHTEWGSIYNYSAEKGHWRNTPARQVSHHHGGSAQIPRIRQNALTYGAKGAEVIQMRYVDRIHYVGEEWEHGFAYCMGAGPLTGLLYEARSWWYPHGAHHNDPYRTDFPLYHAIGLADDTYTDAQIDAHFTVSEMLTELFGMDPRSHTDHGSIPGNSTSCAGLFRAVAQATADGTLVRPASSDYSEEEIMLVEFIMASARRTGLYDGPVGPPDTPEGPSSDEVKRVVNEVFRQMEGHRHEMRYGRRLTGTPE